MKILDSFSLKAVLLSLFVGLIGSQSISTAMSAEDCSLNLKGKVAVGIEGDSDYDYIPSFIAGKLEDKGYYFTKDSPNIVNVSQDISPNILGRNHVIYIEFTKVPNIKTGRKVRTVYSGRSTWWRGHQPEILERAVKRALRKVPKCEE